MNYVQLCQMVHRLIGAGNEAAGSVPANTAAITAAVPGDLVYELSKFVNDAYEEIVLDQDNWSFMVGELNISVTPKIGATAAYAKNLFTGTTSNIDSAVLGTVAFNGFVVPYTILAGGVNASNVAVTALVPDFACVVPLNESGTFRYLLVNETDAGVPIDGTSTQCAYTPYKDFRGWSDAMNVVGKPSQFTIALDGGLWLNTVPDKTYQLRCDYRRKFVPLSTTTGVSSYPFTSNDTPIFPARYHSAIGYRAAAMFCEQRPDVERFTQFQRRYLDVLDSMRGELLPEWQFNYGAFYE